MDVQSVPSAMDIFVMFVVLNVIRYHDYIDNLEKATFNSVFLVVLDVNNHDDYLFGRIL